MSFLQEKGSFLNECTEAPTCQYCMKKGHVKDNFYKKNYDERGGSSAVSFEALVNSKNEENIYMIWIGDTGASRHMVQDDVFLWNKKVCNENVTMGNSEEVKISVKGDIMFKVNISQVKFYINIVELKG